MGASRHIILLVLIIFALAIWSLTVSAAGSPTCAKLSVALTLRLDPGVTVKAMVADPTTRSLYVALNNRTLLKFDLSGSRPVVCAREKIDGIPVKMFVIEPQPPHPRSLAVVYKNGWVDLLETDNLQRTKRIKVTKPGEELESVCIPFTGKYLVAVLGYSISGTQMDRLRIISLDDGSVIYDRHYWSDDRVANIFYVYVTPDYYIIDVSIDKTCHLCRLTDTRVEVYKIAGNNVTKLFSKKWGYVDVAVDSSTRLVIAVKHIASGDKYEAIVFNYTNGKVVSTIYLSRIPSSMQFRNGILAFSYRPLSYDPKSLLVASWTGKCLFSIKCGSRVVAYILSKDFLVAFYPAVVKLLDSGGHTLDQVAFNEEEAQYAGYPSSVACIDNYVVAVYQGRLIKIIRIVTESTVYVTVVKEGKPVAGALVEIKMPGYYRNAKTNSSGVAVFWDVPLGNAVILVTYGKVKAEKEYDVSSLVENIRVSIGVGEKTYNVKVRVVTDLFLQNGSRVEVPIAGAEVKLAGADTAKAITGSNGVAVLSVPPGSYNLSVVARGYRSWSKLINVSGNRSINVTMQPLLYNFTIRAPCPIFNYCRNITVIRRPNYVVKINSSIEKNGELLVLRDIIVGNYTVKIKFSCINTPYEINVTIPGSENPYTIENCMCAINGANTKNVVSKLKLIESVLNRTAALCYRLNASLPPLEPLVDYRGREVEIPKVGIVVLDFFYTKCEGCKQIIPALREIYAELNSSVEIYSVSVLPSDTPEILEHYRKEYGVQWNILRDDVGLYKRFNVTTFPTVIVIVNGRVVFRAEGAKINSIPEVQLQGIAKYLAAPSVVIAFSGFVMLAISFILKRRYQGCSSEW